METWVGGKRFEHTPAQLDIAGNWEISIDHAPTPVVVKVSGKRKLTGKIADEKIRGMTLRNQRLSFDIAGTSWDREGIVRLTLFLDQDLSPAASFDGHGLWPDGTAFACTAVYAASSDDDAQDDAPEQDESKTPDATATQAAAQHETGAESSADDPAESSANDPDEETSEQGAESETKAKPPSKSSAEDQEASDDTETQHGEGDEADSDAESENKTSTPISDPLYPVNYPLGAFGRESLPPQPELLVFKNATVWTNTDVGILEDATVVVRRGKIESVGKNLSYDSTAEVVDLEGKHLTPGIIDCHSHIATDGGVNESTQAVTAEVRIGDFVDPDDISIYRQLAGGVTAANVLHGSANPIGGQNQVIKMRWGVAPEALKFAAAPPGIKFALGENVKQSNWGDDHTTRYPQTRMGVDEIIRDSFERAKEYARGHQDWKTSRRGAAPRIDLELEALAEVLAGQRWIHCHSYRQSELLALMQTCDEYGIKIGTFQHILEGYKVADEMARRGIMGSAFADWWAYKFEVYDAIPHAGTLMHNAGVVVSFNSDDAELGRHLNIDAAKAMRYGGLDPESAFKFVTLNAAKQLRIEDRVGAIAPGKDADLAVWTHSPLSIYAVCKQTWVDGRQYFSRADDHELRRRDRERHAALVQRVLDSGAQQLRPDEDDQSLGELWPREDIFCHGHGGHGHE